MVSMRDVSRKAGVSVATVSHVINKTKYVTPELTQRVLAAIDELDYHPSAVARSLKKGKTGIIGLVISDIELTHFASIVRGAQDVLENEQYSVLLCNCDENSSKEKNYLDIFRSSWVDGIIMSPTGHNGIQIQMEIDRGMPIVLVDRLCPGVKAPAVTVNNKKASYEAVQHLIRNGHRRIGFLGGIAHLSTVQKRLQGYKQALEAAGVEFDPNLVKFTDSKPTSGEVAGYELLSMDNPPSAIFVSVGSLTVGLLRALEHIGIDCPNEVSIVQFDDPDSYALNGMQITSVRQPAYDMGATAGRILLQILSGDADMSIQDKMFETNLCKRGSVKDYSLIIDA